MTTTTRICISTAIQRIVEGKLEDRRHGPLNGNLGDVYWKILDQLEGGPIGLEGVIIEANRSDLIELNEEMKWALDGERDLRPGEPQAARSLLKKTARFINVLGA